jgi:uncharacterized cofD-like protein
MFIKWFTVGLKVKRWLLVGLLGNVMVGVALAGLIVNMTSAESLQFNWAIILVLIGSGGILIGSSQIALSRNLLAPYRLHHQGSVVDVVFAHSKRHKGLRVVAIGGGTGLPSVLRGLKAHTSNITAVVTVADDGGSSGILRRDLGVIPPGDIRNNIAALADDESLMTRLFQHRFDNGDLGGHAFGNLFIAALASISGGVDTALTEIGRVLNIQGRVLPATLDDVNLVASVRLPGKAHPIRIQGESKISEVGGQIEQIGLTPASADAYEESVQAILDADLVVIGPGSLYTSILPNLMVQGISNAILQSRAYRVYVCNVATQPGETEDYSVADHVMALEQHIGRGMFTYVLANNATPTLNAGVNTHYVTPVPKEHEIKQRYKIRYTDLTDTARPWRHDPQKLAAALLKLFEEEKVGASAPIFDKV